MIGSFNDQTHFPHKLLLADTQISMLRKTFANGSSEQDQDNIMKLKTYDSSLSIGQCYLCNDG